MINLPDAGVLGVRSLIMLEEWCVLKDVIKVQIAFLAMYCNE